jgi:hypothetical protein
VKLGAPNLEKLGASEKESAVGMSTGCCVAMEALAHRLIHQLPQLDDVACAVQNAAVSFLACAPSRTHTSPQ